MTATTKKSFFIATINITITTTITKITTNMKAIRKRPSVLL